VAIARRFEDAIAVLRKIWEFKDAVGPSILIYIKI
jgi:hypothetical protein